MDLQVLLDEIHEDTERENELHANETEAKRINDEAEKLRAEEVRTKPTETFGDTLKRNKKNGDEYCDVTSPPSETTRRSGSESPRKAELNGKQVNMQILAETMQKAELNGMQVNMQTMAETMQKAELNGMQVNMQTMAKLVIRCTN